MSLNKFNRTALVITSPLEAELQNRQIEYEALEPASLLVETEYSVISAGTELAIYRGIESWAPLPYVPGYGSAGRVIEVGSAVHAFRPGDRVFTYGPHASINVIDGGAIVKVPDGLEAFLVPLTVRMGQVAMTAVRVSSAELGDYVAVQGLGLVGNLAAQFFKLAGCKVIGIDTSAKRIATAHKCGLASVLDATTQDVPAAVREITGGEMAQVVVEATGIPALARNAMDLAAQRGELILLGTPRGNYEGNAAELLMRVHEASTFITLKGAHEWAYPLTPIPGIKHSIERNINLIIDLAANGKIHARELISHVIPPCKAPEAYKELYRRNEDYFGVVIDWTAERGRVK